MVNHTPVRCLAGRLNVVLETGPQRRLGHRVSNATAIPPTISRGTPRKTGLLSNERGAPALTGGEGENPVGRDEQKGEQASGGLGALGATPCVYSTGHRYTSVQQPLPLLPLAEARTDSVPDSAKPPIHRSLCPGSGRELRHGDSSAPASASESSPMRRGPP